MKCNLYLPCDNLSDNEFNVNQDYYSEDSYIKALENSLYNTNDEITNIQDDKMLFTKKQSEYTTCEAILMNENGFRENLDSLISYNVKNESFILNIKLNYDSIEEDFEESLKMWIESHKKVSKIQADDSWLFQHLPRKNIKFKCLNNYGGDTFGELLDCIILEITNNSSLIVLVDKLVFLKEL